MTEPLKPCPFDGGYPRLFGHHVYCETCGAATRICSTPDEAAETWNQRDKTPEAFDMEYLFDDDLQAPTQRRTTYTVKRGNAN